MSRFVIRGGVPLHGSIRAAANKNAILPIMAATLLSDEECILTNVPRISDVVVMGNLLVGLGAEVDGLGTTELRIRCANVQDWRVDEHLARRIRASILLAGPLLVRFGKAVIPHPGGCIIGRRDVSTHLSALEAMGAQITVTPDSYDIRCDGLQGRSIFLEEASVTATENTVMAACLSKGVTTIEHAAGEPHVADLCALLSAMGAQIEGAGSNRLIIHGVDRLHGATHSIVSDHIDIGTLAVAALVTRGRLAIQHVVPEHLSLMLIKMESMGVRYSLEGDTLTVYPSELVATRKIDTDPWPGFPTDLASVFITLATQAAGTTLVHDWMYEGRMFFIEKLASMGANVILCDPHRCLVSGPTTLVGREVQSPDLRAGMALMLAALCAEGKSVVTNAELIERGYENVVDRFSALGARIEVQN